jgi:hypothetical protein
MTEQIARSEVIDRCLAAALCCVEVGNDRRANDLMKAEFRAVARDVSQWQLSSETKVELFLLPMEEELVLRHGLQVGRKLFSDFIDAFWVQTWTDVPLDPKKLQRAEPLTDSQQLAQVARSLRRMIVVSHFAGFCSEN